MNQLSQIVATDVLSTRTLRSTAIETVAADCERLRFIVDDYSQTISAPRSIWVFASFWINGEWNRYASKHFHTRRAAIEWVESQLPF